MRLLLSGPLVTPIRGESRRFTVQSRSGQGVHVVDLESMFPLPECSCRDFQCRKLPHFRKTGEPIPCVHGDQALRFFALLCVQATSPLLNQKPA